MYSFKIRSANFLNPKCLYISEENLSDFLNNKGFDYYNPGLSLHENIEDNKVIEILLFKHFERKGFQTYQDKDGLRPLVLEMLEVA